MEIYSGIGIFLKPVEGCCFDIMIGRRPSLDKSSGLEPFLWLRWLMCFHYEPLRPLDRSPMDRTIYRLLDLPFSMRWFM